MTAMPPDARAQLGNVVRLCQDGAFHEAESICRSLVRESPRLADAWNLLATILQQLEDPEQSLDAIKHALKLRSDIPPYWLTRGNAEMALGQFSSAAESLSRATRLAPAFAAAHLRLGMCRAAQGRVKEAIASYGEAMCLAPEVAEIHFRLGEALAGEAQWNAAIQFFQAAFARDPQYALDRQPGIACLRRVAPASISAFWRAELLHFLRSHDTGAFSRFADVVKRLLKATAPLHTVLNSVRSPSGLQKLPASELGGIMDDELFRLWLCTGLIDDLDVEAVLTQLRSMMLLDREFRAGVPPAFGCALAVQCFNNEYVFTESPEESAAADALLDTVRTQCASRNPPPDVGTISLLAMYRPIHDLPGVDGVTVDAAGPTWTLLLKKAVKDVLAERIERTRIGALGRIDDNTSRAVRQLYEESPYPRWFSLDRRPPVGLTDWASDSVFAGPVRAPTVETVRILVAGCGTGKEACELALDIANAQVLAVDLSLSSLAFAKRTAQELGIDNIEFRQADLLNLAIPEESFDLVSSSGVIHHMQHPEQGLEALARQVRPGGFLRVALYSERARANINAARQFVKESGIPPDPAGIRRFRQLVHDSLRDAPFRRLSGLSDFYSLSACRDLLFHIMEHQYRSTQIDSMLRHAGLIPIDPVQGLEPDKLAEYRRRFPDDPSMANFGNWDIFEQAFPDTFIRMFSVRARKPDKAAG